ncbi:MAG: hypothetical protein EXS31_04320 [Pedosphaera sp.]|nr:hypothetical protein [Pedosphaera sp.]
MIEDPISEVRRIRGELATEFNYDMAAYCAYLRKQQGKSGHKVIDLAKKRPLVPRRKTPATA